MILMPLPMKRNTTTAHVQRTFHITALHTTLTTLIMGIGIMAIIMAAPTDIGGMAAGAIGTVTKLNTFLYCLIRENEPHVVTLSQQYLSR